MPSGPRASPGDASSSGCWRRVRASRCASTRRCSRRPGGRRLHARHGRSIAAWRRGREWRCAWVPTNGSCRARRRRLRGLPGMWGAALAGLHHSLVDVSHRHVAFRVAGARAADVLNSGCPLDLSPPAFPAGAATRTLLGKAEVILAKTDDRADLRGRMRAARSRPTFTISCSKRPASSVRSLEDVFAAAVLMARCPAWPEAR